MKSLPHREVAEEAKRLESLGWTRESGGGGHPAFTHPEYGRIALPCTPTGSRWQQNFRTRLARKMNIDRAELDRRLGIERVKRTGEKQRRQRNEAGRQARVIPIHRTQKPQQPRRVGTPEQRLAQLRQEQERAAARLRLAMPGTAAYACALDDAARLRTEAFTAREELEREAA